MEKKERRDNKKGKERSWDEIRWKRVSLTKKKKKEKHINNVLFVVVCIYSARRLVPSQNLQCHWILSQLC